MDFELKDFSFLFFPLWLSMGTLGDLIEPFIQNKVVFVGAKNSNFTCSSSLDNKAITWNFNPLGGGGLREIERGPATLDSYFQVVIQVRSTLCHLIVKIANESTAGVYNCYEPITTKRSALLIVIIEEPVCKFVQKPNVTCEKLLQLSCTMSYAANESYVIVNMQWSTEGDSVKSLRSLMERSTSANITTATSTLSVARPDNYTAIPIYRCTTTFNLVDQLPDDFARNKPNYTHSCVPPRLSYNVSCSLTQKSGESDKSSEDNLGCVRGVSVGSSERNNIIERVVSIAGALLIGTRTV